MKKLSFLVLLALTVGGSACPSSTDDGGEGADDNEGASEGGGNEGGTSEGAAEGEELQPVGPGVECTTDEQCGDGNVCGSIYTMQAPGVATKSCFKGCTAGSACQTIDLEEGTCSALVDGRPACAGESTRFGECGNGPNKGCGDDAPQCVMANANAPQTPQDDRLFGFCAAPCETTAECGGDLGCSFDLPLQGPSGPIGVCAPYTEEAAECQVIQPFVLCSDGLICDYGQTTGRGECIVEETEGAAEGTGGDEGASSEGA